MKTETPREFEQIHWLYHQFRDAMNRGGVSRQTALDALEYALEELLSDVCESEEHVKQYFETMHERATRAWRRQNAVAG